MSIASTRARNYWTAEEDTVLHQEAMVQLKATGIVKDWTGIASKLPGRTNKDCRKRWSKVGANVNKGLWSPDEDDRLRKAVEEHGYCWTPVASAVGTRHADQCSKRWSHFLDPNLSHEVWDPKEDERLLAAIQTYGRSWKAISEVEFPQRSATDIKNRYITLERRLKMDDRRSSSSASSSSSNSHHNPARIRPEDLSTPPSGNSENELEMEQSFDFTMDFSLDALSSDDPEAFLGIPLSIPSIDPDMHIPSCTMPTVQDPSIAFSSNALASFDLTHPPLDPHLNDLNLDETAMLSTSPSMGSYGANPDQFLALDTPEQRYTLLLEDVRPDVLSRVMNVVFESPEQVKLKVTSSDR